MVLEDNSYIELIRSVKEKKELRGIADEIVGEFLGEYIKKNNIETLNITDKDKKVIIKEVRAELRRYSGRFQEDSGTRETLLENGDIDELLKTHTSTKERLENYSEIKKVLKELNSNSILDIGCGLNPLALAEKGIDYYALDIKKDELELIEKFFNEREIRGKCILYDIRKIKEGELPEADICLIFKVFDVIENKGHKLAEKILNCIKCKDFLISFSTKTLSGKPMNHPQRGWIERLLTRKRFKFKQIITRNEIFYLAKKI